MSKRAATCPHCGAPLSRHATAPVEITTNSIGMKLRLIPAGEFMMGSPGTESNADDETQHRVTLTKPFYLGVTEVTQEQYQKVMGKNPSQFKGPQNPVEKVRWADAVEFCRKLSAMPAEKTAGHVYRLPTEAEWEYACRSGTTTAYGFGDDASRLGDYGWYDNKNSGRTTHPVGGKQPNGWGLYDMHGNVMEWCQDWYGDYPSRSTTDPTGATSGSYRVSRGGSWSSIAWNCRSAHRDWDTPGRRYYYLGFRVLRSSIGSAAGGGVKPGERSGSVGPSGANGKRLNADNLADQRPAAMEFRGGVGDINQDPARPGPPEQSALDEWIGIGLLVAMFVAAILMALALANTFLTPSSGPSVHEIIMQTNTRPRFNKAGPKKCPTCDKGCAENATTCPGCGHNFD